MSTTRRDRTQLFAAVFAALLIALFVGRASSAAFTASTENPDNSVATGTISLTDNDSGAAKITMTNTVPGSTSGVTCIQVTYGGSVVAANLTAVKLYAAQAVTDTGTLASQLDMVVTQGTAGSTCASFTAQSTIVNTTVATFDDTTTYSASTYGTWIPDVGGGDTMRPYRVQVTVNSGASNTHQGQTVSNLDLMFGLETTP